MTEDDLREALRDDIAEAAGRMGSSVGARKEMRNLEEYLQENERVRAIVAGHYGPGSGLLVLTDRRILFVFDGLVHHTVQDFSLDDVSTVQWESGFNLGVITLFASGTLEVKGVDDDGGEYFVATTRDALNAYQART
jgi:Bacterial PH domain